MNTPLVNTVYGNYEGFGSCYNIVQHSQPKYDNIIYTVE